jgi:P-type E1-E2 ATPase
VLAVTIPGRGELQLEHLVLDVNGTLACDGVLIPGVAERLHQVRNVLTVHLLSADTHGQLDAIARDLGVPATRLRTGEPEPPQKATYIRQLHSSTVVAIGNGANDVDMLSEAAIGIVVVGPEGAAVAALTAADLVTGSITDALDLLSHPKRLIASLRR